MTCAALTKLLVVLLVAFILCLPEFFSSHRGLKVSFCCESLRSCSDGDPGRSVGMWVKGQPICRGEGNGTEQNSSYWLCETQTNLAYLFENGSLVDPLQVSLVVQIDSPVALNVTFNHYLDNTSLLIKNSESHQGLFHCCRSPNQSQNLQNLTSAPNHCFLYQQPSNQTANLGFPRQMKGSGRCVSKLVWLALVFSVICIIVVAALYQALCKTLHLKGRVEQPPNSVYQTNPLTIRRTTSFDDTPDLSLQHRDTTGDVFSEIPYPEENGEPLFKVYRCRKGLSPIHEIENHEVTPEKGECEKSLPLTTGFTHSIWEPMSQLHHRGHPPTISLMAATHEDEK